MTRKRKVVTVTISVLLIIFHVTNSTITTNKFVPGASYGSRTAEPSSAHLEVRDVLECARRCSHDPGCNSIEYMDGDPGNCYILAAVTDRFGSSGAVFWDKEAVVQEAENPCLANTVEVYSTHFITFQGGGKTILCFGQWLVIQKRSKSTNCEHFNRTWTEYKDGFGTVADDEDFWMGNEYIYEMTKNQDFKLKLTLIRGAGAPWYENYDTFYLDNEEGNYALHVSNWNGIVNAFSDPTVPANNAPFSTFDKDNDYSGQNCALDYKSGWWYSACQVSNLNGLCADQEGFMHDNSCQQCRSVQWKAGPPAPVISSVVMAIAPQGT